LRRSPAKGAFVSNKSLTIVLPVYNGESRLTHHVTEMLELASELTFAIRGDVSLTMDPRMIPHAVAQELATQSHRFRFAAIATAAIRANHQHGAKKGVDRRVIVMTE